MKIDALLDTNILIDVSREYQPALTWLSNNPGLVFAIPSPVRMELILGVKNKAEQEKVVKLLRPYAIVYPTEHDAKWAMEQFELYFLTYQVEILDCFIASIAVGLHLPIYTRNVKHLNLFEGITIHTPY